MNPSPADAGGLFEPLQVNEKVMGRSGAHLCDGLHQCHLLPRARELPSFLCKGFQWLSRTRASVPFKGVPRTFHPVSLLLPPHPRRKVHIPVLWENLFRGVCPLLAPLGPWATYLTSQSLCYFPSSVQRGPQHPLNRLQGNCNKMADVKC